MKRLQDKKKNRASKDEVESDEPESSKEESSEDQSSDNEGDGDDTGQKDGMADMMAKILNQKTNRSVPVLEKRNTAHMKLIDEGREERNMLKKAQAERAKQRNKQLILPGKSKIENERHLRKLATKGVVALFNAVAEAQRIGQEAEDTQDGDKQAKKAKAEKLASVDIKQMSKDNFLDLLSGGGTSASISNGSQDGFLSKASGLDEDSDGDAASTGDSEHGVQDGTWGALRDDYFHENVSGAGRLKDWNDDKEGDVNADSEESADELLENKAIKSTLKRSAGEAPRSRTSKKHRD
eukprot:GSChrysophyteH1.ASY1.ANO1.272.1 assembled CDS